MSGVFKIAQTRFVAELGPDDVEISSDWAGLMRAHLDADFDVFRWTPWATIPVSHTLGYFSFEGARRPPIPWAQIRRRYEDGWEPPWPRLTREEYEREVQRIKAEVEVSMSYSEPER